MAASVIKLTTPGVYVQEIPTFPPSVAEVETAIPAFIGYTEKASKAGVDLKKIPTKVTDFNQYTLWFGAPQTEAADSIVVTVTDDGSGNPSATAKTTAAKQSKYNLAYAMKHYFDNGGATCYVVSVDSYAAAPGTVTAKDLKDGITAVFDVDEVTLLVVPEAPVSDDYAGVVQKMIEQAAKLADRFAIIDPAKVTPKDAANPAGDIKGDTDAIKNAATNGLQSIRYAAAYYPNLITTYSRAYATDDLVIDAASSAPYKGKKVGELAGSAAYAKIVAAVGKAYVELPPSGAIAGLYARVDSTKGVWKAPANEGLLSVAAPSLPISDREQGNLNIDVDAGKSINAIRTFPGYGTLVWGARTLNGNDNEWRYISVRRFFIMVEESIKKSIQWAVFEPNTIDTWVKVQAMIENYLFLKWKQGALAGAKPEQAFYVKVGLGTTMTAVDILEGRMNVEIGMAVAHPAEFIVLKFSQIMQQP